MARDKKRNQTPEQNASQPAPGEGAPVNDGMAAEGMPAGQPEASIPVAEFESISAELAQARKLAEENFNGWQRERADFLNYKKRIERDQAQMASQISGEVLKKYLVILDDLERALKNRPTDPEGAAWASGIELIYRKLKNILEAEGLVQIQAEKEQFDPNLHEAITMDDHPEFESGQVVEVLQQGYKIGDRVLRPALVRVAR